jgi:hypothetical protein
MVRSALVLLALALLGIAVPLPKGTAQTADQASTPAAPDPLPGLPRPPDQPRSLLLPPTPMSLPPPVPGPYFEVDPLLDPPELPPPGWFTNLEAGVVGPHVKNKVTLDNALPGGASLRLPSASLDWTVSPRVAVGYRLPAGFGEISLGYRFLASEGTGTTLGQDSLATLRSRLDLNLIDLDYASREFSLWPCWEMTWWFGLRWAYVYFDSRADEPFAAAATGSGIFETRTSNSYVGFGPHAGLGLERNLGETGLAVVGRVDGWISLGRIRQGFFETSTTPGPNGLPLAGETRLSSSQAVPSINVQLGLGWQPPGWCHTHVFAGYVYEYWWNAGRESSTLDSRGEVSDQGILFRAEFNF